ncbi:MAG: hypothetical protein WCK39_10630 [Methanomassiliicoccales archaeon]
MSQDPAALHQEAIAQMSLRPGERIVRMWKCRADVYSEPASDEDSGWGKSGGLLVLTNLRLTFLQNTGLLKRGYLHYHSAELGSITTATVHKHGLLVEWMGKYRPEKNNYDKMEDLDARTMEGTGGTDLQRAAADILAARSGAFAAPPPLATPPPVLDFNTVMRMAAPGGRIAGLRCPKCSNVMQFPAYGNEVWCPFCQTNIRAEQLQTWPQLIIREG